MSGNKIRLNHKHVIKYLIKHYACVVLGELKTFPFNMWNVLY